MGCCKYILYLAIEGKEHWVEISPVVCLDFSYYLSVGRHVEMICLSPPLPIGAAHYLKMKVEKSGFVSSKMRDILSCIPYLDLVKNEQLVLQKSLFVKSELKKIGYEGLASPRHLTCGSLDLEKLPADNDLEEVKGALSGRLLFEDEIERALVEQGRFLECPLEKVLQVLYLQGEVERLPGVGLTSLGEPECFRCGEKRNIVAGECSSTPAPCFYCEECILMGASKLCRPLYFRPRSFSVGFHTAASTGCKELKVLLDFDLTPAQKDASNALGNFVRESSLKELLVWAVCGAGKTEVSFEAIASALSSGAKVLYAVPRRDVVLELLPRFKKAFPDTSMSVLYGGCREGKFQDVQLTLATTHQVIRFYRNFDLVVLDEVDAFPYRGSRMLYDSVQRARVPGGKIVYLTATPRSGHLRAVSEGKIALITIPARHHGFPLPVPQIAKARSLESRRGRFRVPGVVRDFLHVSIEGDKAQVFVFVPAIALVQRVADALQEEVRLPPFSNWNGDWVKGSHARDPDRDVKRDAFSRGDFPIFVTTSIMERGITVPNANVLVLFAEYEKIYDTGTLVQMAGRSGRSAHHPSGRVLFVGTRITSAMRAAVEQILSMNREARMKGYLRADWKEVCLGD